MRGWQAEVDKLIQCGLGWGWGWSWKRRAGGRPPTDASQASRSSSRVTARRAPMSRRAGLEAVRVRGAVR